MDSVGTGLTAYRVASALVPEKQRYRLDTNWRSSSRLVNAVNRLFEPVFQSRCGKGSPVGFTAVKAGKTVDRQLEWLGAEKPISLVPAENEVTAAESIVSEIRAILDSRTGAVWTMDNGHTHPVEASDIAVLVRSGLQEDDVIKRLSVLNIPAIRYRDASIFNQPLIPMLTALLEAIKEPRSMRLMKGRSFPVLFFRLPPDMLLQFEEAGYLDNFPEWNMELREMFNSGHSVRALTAFFSYAAEMGKWAGQFKREAEAERLSRPWTIRILSEPGGERLWQDWNHIGEIIQERQSAGMRDISRIISWLKTNADGSLGVGEEGAQIRMTTEAPAVTVMTMHSAKGLEFPLVFLHGGYKGSSRRSDKTGSDYRFETDDALMVDRLCREQYFNAHRAHCWEEEKRLWYVAFTRASVKLWVPLSVGKEKKTTQLDSLWGLMTGQVDGFADLPPHELQDSNPDQFRRQMTQEIMNSFQDLIHFPDPAASDTPEPLSRNIQKSGRLAPLPDSYTGSRDPVTSSFTSLVHQSENTAIGDRDRDVREEEGSISNANVLLADDRGLEFGQFVHACMELCDINLAADEDAWQNDDETDRLFADQSARYYPPGWYQSRSADVKALIRLGLCAPIPGLGRISDLAPGSYRREIEFQMHVPEHAHLRLGNVQDSTDRLMQLGRGFLKGYIDLLACKDGQWWVVDWKTNMPRHGQSWEEAMDNHHYRFQYELYLLALCRTLHAAWNRPVDWENEIGGAAYVFLRGLHNADPAYSQGLVVEKPDLEKMHALADLLACSEIIA